MFVDKPTLKNTHLSLRTKVRLLELIQTPLFNPNFCFLLWWWTQTKSVENCFNYTLFWSPLPEMIKQWFFLSYLYSLKFRRNSFTATFWFCWAGPISCLASYSLTVGSVFKHFCKIELIKQMEWNFKNENTILFHRSVFTGLVWT